MSRRNFPALLLIVFLFFAGLQGAFAADASDQAVSLQNAFIEVAKRVGPAVVSISTVHTEKVGVRRHSFGGLGGSPFEDDFLDRFFKDFFEGVPEEREFQQRGLGSGVIIDADGLILTNEHVVKGADKITVTLADGRKFDGQVKGADARSDLAVIKIKAKGLPFAELGNSDEVKIGQWAIAIGNPFGYMVGSSQPTMTVGVVSALERSIRTAPAMNRDYTGLIQTDAAINPGNSGGPLVDINGRVIGVNVAIFSTSGGYQGIGFAIPVNRGKENIPVLAQGKRILYGWIGVQVQDLNEQLAQYFGLPDTKGALIVEVIPDGPAEKAGLQAGDVVKSYNGEEVQNTQKFVEKVSRTKAGTNAAIGVLRSGREFKITIRIEPRPEDAAQFAEKGQPQPSSDATKKWRGIEISNITPQIAKRYGIQAETGVFVYKVDINSPAYQAGLRVGDIIEQINRIDVNNVSDFGKAVSSAKGDALIRTGRGYAIVKEETSQ